MYISQILIFLWVNQYSHDIHYTTLPSTFFYFFLFLNQINFHKRDHFGDKLLQLIQFKQVYINVQDLNVKLHQI